MRRLDLVMNSVDIERLRGLLTAREVLPCERKRYLALWHVQQGATALQIEQWKLMSADSVSRTVKRYQAGGLDALLERVHPGRSSRITLDVVAAIKEELCKDQQVWTSASLMTYVQTEHGLTIRRTALREQLKRHGLSWQRTRYVVAGHADPHEKKAFADTLDVLKRGR